jgi:DNA topoisomerase IB
VDPDVVELVKSLKRRRSGGDELLAYKLGSRWRDVKSADINDYLKEAAGGDFSAKDFRTWKATCWPPSRSRCRPRWRRPRRPPASE